MQPNAIRRTVTRVEKPIEAGKRLGTRRTISTTESIRVKAVVTGRMETVTAFATTLIMNSSVPNISTCDNGLRAFGLSGF